MSSYNFDKMLLSGGEPPASINNFNDDGISASVLAGEGMALPWASFALKGAGAVAGGVQAYLAYKEQERQRKLQEQMMKSQDDRAWEQLRDNQRAYSEGATQRNANASITLGQATGQNQSLRDKLMMLSGTVRA